MLSFDWECLLQDPGNLEGDLQAGAAAGYTLLWVLVWSTVMVSIVPVTPAQVMSARLHPHGDWQQSVPVLSSGARCSILAHSSSLDRSGLPAGVLLYAHVVVNIYCMVSTCEKGETQFSTSS